MYLLSWINKTVTKGAMACQQLEGNTPTTYLAEKSSFQVLPHLHAAISMFATIFNDFIRDLCRRHAISRPDRRAPTNGRGACTAERLHECC